MRIDRREFGVLAVAAIGPRVAGQTPAAPSLAGSSRSMAGFPEGDFYGVAAEFDEVNAVQRKIEPDDIDSFVTAWTAMADGVARQAGALLEDGRRVSARDAYLRAANYYSRVQQTFLRIGDGVRIMPPYEKMRAAWKTAWTITPPPFEQIQIKYDDTTLPGIFAHADPCRRARMPVVFEFSGSDHINERSFFRSEWRKFHNRGLSYLTLEGPGQGEPLRVRHMALRPDYETVAKAAIDFLTSRSDVDAGRIGVFGTAFGGYFAAQAAVDPRVRAVACRSASFDLWQDSYQFSRVIRRHLEYMLGVEGEASARRALEPYRLDTVAPRVRAPIAIYHGGRDDVQDPRGAQRLYDAIPGAQKTLKILPDAPRGVGREPELELVDWLTTRLS